MGSPARRVLLGQIGAPHGVRGDVRVKTFTADPAAIADYGPLATPDGRLLEIERLRPAGSAPEMVIVHFKGVADRDAAAALTGTELGVERAQLPPAEDEDEFYQADLIGLSAFDPAGAPLGMVRSVVNFGAGDLLEIAPTGGETFYVPFTREIVPELDIAGGRLTVALTPEMEDETAGGDGDRRGPEQ